MNTDTQRLDWLSNMDGPFGDYGTDSTADLIVCCEVNGKKYPTLRDALDAAMSMGVIDRHSSEEKS